MEGPEADLMAAMLDGGQPGGYAQLPAVQPHGPAGLRLVWLDLPIVSAGFAQT